MFQFVFQPVFQRASAIFVLIAALFFWLLWQGVSLFRSSAVALTAAGVLGVIWLLEHLIYHEPEKIREKSADFDWGMHYLRGFAIVCIVVMHILTRFEKPQITRAFFLASTVYFLFISGYLCQYLALKRPVVPRVFYQKKFLNVILPYIVMSLLTIGLVWLTDVPRVGLPKPDAITPAAVLKMLAMGKAQIPYWYIPFVAVLFLVSPLITRLSLKALVWLTICSFVVAIIFPLRTSSHQAFAYKDVFFKYTYFSFYYLAGFLYARLKPHIEPHLKAYAPPALFFALILAANLLVPDLFGKCIIRNPFAYSFQKFLFLVPVLACAVALKNKKIYLLDLLANYSFALFFLHYFFIQDWMRIRQFVHGLFAAGSPALLTTLDIGLILLFTAQNLLLAIVLKHAAGRCSKSILGV